MLAHFAVKVKVTLSYQGCVNYVLYILQTRKSIWLVFGSLPLNDPGYLVYSDVN